jgi:hypothetical protein
MLVQSLVIINGGGGDRRPKDLAHIEDPGYRF